MMMPSIFGENLFDDDWMNFPFEQDFWGKKNPLYGKHAKNLMKTDIRDVDGNYELEIDLPGFKKENVKIELKDGYLIVNASTKSETTEEDKKTKYIRKERYAGSMSRSFYVGDNMKQEDIKAKFENGVLTLQVPKKEEIPEEQTKKFITIG